MEYLKTLFGAFYEKQVRYLLCGGLAVNLYGIPRMTADIDLVIDWNEQNIRNFEEALSSVGYKSNLFIQLASLIKKSIRLQMIKEKKLIAFSYSSKQLKAMNLDVIIDFPLNFDECWQAREEKTLFNVKTYVISVQHLIQMKTYAGRIQDKEDIVKLKQFLK